MEHQVTEYERCEAEFTRQILIDPADTTTRLVFADWLDEFTDRHVQAKYLREIRKHKFIRLVKTEGSWALFPQWVEHRGARVSSRNCYDHFPEPPPNPSPRCVYWLRRIRRGWVVPGHVRGDGYSMATKYFGVYVSEYLRKIAPMLRYYL